MIFKNCSIVLIQVGSFYEVYGILCADGSYKVALLKEFMQLMIWLLHQKICVLEKKMFLWLVLDYHN